MVGRTLLLFIAIGIFVYFLIASITDLKAVLQYVFRLDLSTWTFVLALSLTNYCLRFVRWHWYLRKLGHTVSARRHVPIYFMGFALTPTPGKLGEAVRAVYLKPYGVNPGRCLAMVYTERLLDVLVISILATLIVFTAETSFRWFALAGGGIAAILMSIQLPPVLSMTRKLVQRLPGERLRKAGRFFIAFQNDVTSLINMKFLLSGLVIGLAAWAAEGIGLFLVAEKLGINLYPGAAVGVYATAMLIGALSFIPGGLGSTEAAMVTLLSLSGAPLPAAIAITGLVRIATFWFAIALGGMSWLWLEARRLPIDPNASTLKQELKQC